MSLRGYGDNAILNSEMKNEIATNEMSKRNWVNFHPKKHNNFIIKDEVK